MTKRTRSVTKRPSSKAANPSETPTADMLEKRVVAFAEQLGRIAGTVHARAEGWMDGDALKKELARVRDGAAELLQRLTPGAPENKPAARSATRRSRARSGGTVDAPGKKHRPALPTDPGANRADSQAAKMRAAKTMVKTPRRRGRG